MPILDFDILLGIQVVLTVFGMYWLISMNDVVPLIISSFLLYSGAYRYFSATSGIGRWVVMSDEWSFDPISSEAAREALLYIILGQTILLITYCFARRKPVHILRTVPDRAFLNWLGPQVLLFGAACLPMVIMLRRQVMEQVIQGASQAFDISGYLSLFPMVMIGIMLLTVLLWKFGYFRIPLTQSLGLMVVIAFIFQTFQPYGRFQLLGWIIASAMVVTAGLQPRIKVIVYALVGVAALTAFSASGSVRTIKTYDQSQALKDLSIQRAIQAEDANMLDGFVMLRQIYPKMLPYSKGGEHLEVLLRPIPRAWWHNKPVGGYMNKLGWTIDDGQGTVGISPTLIGTFYAEGGWIGILLLSVIYGALFAAIMNYSLEIRPFPGLMVQAIFCAVLIPLLRGGDLPGVIAWTGMAFWPCFLLLWVRRDYFGMTKRGRKWAAGLRT